MKTTLMFTCLTALLAINAFANGSGWRVEDKARGTAAVDETYTDEIKKRESAIEKQEKTRQKISENPRNQTFSESFGHVYSKEDDQERQEEKKATEKQKAREGEADGVEYDKKRVWR